MLKIRRAQQNDKDEVLKFCVNTFDWGDYIHHVWDSWYSDPNGQLIIAEYESEEYTKQLNTGRKSSTIVAVSHVHLCPNRKMIWLEGIRIRSDYRRRHVATELIKKMLEYGIEQGTEESAAIVSANNVRSQLLMQSNGFVKVSKWNILLDLDYLKIKEHERLQIFSPKVPFIHSVMKHIGINQCEEFLLYKRKI